MREVSGATNFGLVYNLLREGICYEQAPWLHRQKRKTFGLKWKAKEPLTKLVLLTCSRISAISLELARQNFSRQFKWNCMGCLTVRSWASSLTVGWSCEKSHLSQLCKTSTSPTCYKNKILGYKNGFWVISLFNIAFIIWTGKVMVTISQYERYNLRLSRCKENWEGRSHTFQVPSYWNRIIFGPKICGGDTQKEG